MEPALKLCAATQLPERDGSIHEQDNTKVKAESEAKAKAKGKASSNQKADSDDSNDTDSSDSEGDQDAAERKPGEFINIAYDDLVGWLQDWLVGQKPPEWIKSWSTLFKRMLPLHTFLRCGSCSMHRPCIAFVAGRQHIMALESQHRK